MFLTFFFLEGEKIQANWKHRFPPPRVSPIRHLKRVAAAENAHPQLSSLRQSHTSSIVTYAARIRVKSVIRSQKSKLKGHSYKNMCEIITLNYRLGLN
jgi:hypothetical protein